MGTSISNVLAAGDRTTMLHYNGSTWQEMTHPLTGTHDGSYMYFLDIQGYAGNNIYIVGSHGVNAD